MVVVRVIEGKGQMDEIRIVVGMSEDMVSADRGLSGGGGRGVMRFINGSM